MPALNGARTNSAEYQRFTEIARRDNQPVIVGNVGGFWRQLDETPKAPLDYAVFYPDRPPEYFRQQDIGTGTPEPAKPDEAPARLQRMREVDQEISKLGRQSRALQGQITKARKAGQPFDDVAARRSEIERRISELEKERGTLVQAARPEDQTKLELAHAQVRSLQRSVGELEDLGETATPEQRQALTQRQGQLDRLTRTRDELVSPQGVDTGDITQARGRAEPRPQAPAEPGEPKDFKRFLFNDGTPVYRKAFEDAGFNPDNAINFPIQRQVSILTNKMKERFGFQAIEISKRLDPKEARDILLDVYRAGQDMLGALGYPHDMLSMKGKVRLVLEPYREKGPYLGLYRATSGGVREIHIVGQANTLGHEWTHALDHELMGALANAPNVTQLLTRYTRDYKLDPSDPLAARFAKVVNTLIYDQGAEAAARLRLEHDAQEVNPKGQPTAKAREAQRQLDRLNAGASRMSIQPSGFRQSALTFGNPGYWASVPELLARAHEAYIARTMENGGVDPRGVVMPDEAYLNETDRRLRDTYPRPEDRVNIFQAFDELHEGLRAAGVYGSVGGAMSHDMGISDPAGFRAMAKASRQAEMAVPKLTSIGARLKRARDDMAKVSMFDPKRPDAARSWRQRAALELKYVFYSKAGYLDGIIALSPKEAQPYLQAIRDKLATGRGEGRVVKETFEEQALRLSRTWLQTLSKTMDDYGIMEMSALEDAQLHHQLTTGETTYKGEQIPAYLQAAAGEMRDLLDKVYDANRNAGIDIGYAKNGFYPRRYDQPKITANPQDFRARAGRVYKVVFENEVGQAGDNPQALSDFWDKMRAKGANGDIPQDIVDADNPGVKDAMKQLRANLRRQKVVEREIAAGGPNTAALQAELDQLKADAKDLAEQHHDAIGDGWGTLAANDWYARLQMGYPGDYDTIGPSGSYLNKRVLPPEADQIMKPYLNTEVRDVLPEYIHHAGRRIAYETHFGPKPGETIPQLEQLLRKAVDAGATDGQLVRGIIEAVTGRTSNSKQRALGTIANFVHSFGSLALMARAPFTAAPEIISAGLIRGSVGDSFNALAKLTGQMFRTADAKERGELADALGTVPSRLSESLMTGRSATDYSDTPRLDRMMQNFYRMSGMTAITNAGRRAAMGLHDDMLTKMSRDLLGDDGRKKAQAAREFRELGVPDKHHEAFAQWNVTRDGMPEMQDLMNDPMGGFYDLAVRRLADWTIQDPKKIDRPMLAEHPWMKLAYQYSSFAYSFQRHILDPIMERFKEDYRYSREQGRGRARSAFDTSPYAASIASVGAMLLAANLVTTMVRELMFNGDAWDKHEKDGDLHSWLFGLAMGRTGLGGTLDLATQFYTGLRYMTDIGSIIEGPNTHWLAQNVGDILHALDLGFGPKPNTNARIRNASRAVYNLIIAPALTYMALKLAAAKIPGAAPVIAVAQQKLSSPQSAESFATMIAGPKGAELPQHKTGMPGVPGLPSRGGMGDLPEIGAGPRRATGSNAGVPAGVGGVPLGLLDDFVMPTARAVGAPTARIAASIAEALPGPLKVGAGLVAAGAAATSVMDYTAPYRNAPQHQAPP